MKPNWFIALPLAVGPWYRPLVAGAPREVRVFEPQDLHITVAFLGCCGDELARDAWARALDLPFAPMTIRLDRLVPMGNPKRPSALSLAAAGDPGSEAVSAWIGRVRDPLCDAAHAPRERRSPKPHATVARPRRNAGFAERRAAVEWACARPPVDVCVTLDTLALYTWAEDRRARQFGIVECRQI